MKDKRGMFADEVRSAQELVCAAAALLVDPPVPSLGLSYGTEPCLLDARHALKHGLAQEEHRYLRAIIAFVDFLEKRELVKQSEVYQEGLEISALTQPGPNFTRKFLQKRAYLDTLNMEGIDPNSVIDELDPDAVFRKDKQLISQDLANQDLFCKRIWDFLRSGRSFQAIQLALNSDESWRALSMQPCLIFCEEHDSTIVGNHDLMIWKESCHELAKASQLRWERAIYGVLSDQPILLLKMLDSPEDLLWAHLRTFVYQSYNSVIVAVMRQTFSKEICSLVNLKEPEEIVSVQEHLEIIMDSLIQRFSNLPHLHSIQLHFRLLGLMLSGKFQDLVHFITHTIETDSNSSFLITSTWLVLFLSRHVDTSLDPHAQQLVAVLLTNSDKLSMDSNMYQWFCAFVHPSQQYRLLAAHMLDKVNLEDTKLFIQRLSGNYKRIHISFDIDQLMESITVQCDSMEQKRKEQILIILYHNFSVDGVCQSKPLSRGICRYLDSLLEEHPSQGYNFVQQLEIGEYEYPELLFWSSLFHVYEECCNLLSASHPMLDIECFDLIQRIKRFISFFPHTAPMTAKMVKTLPNLLLFVLRAANSIGSHAISQSITDFLTDQSLPVPIYSLFSPAQLEQMVELSTLSYIQSQ